MWYFTQISCPYTPRQNGLAERKHRHVVEMGLTLMSQAGLPSKFWDDAFTTTYFLINRIPAKPILFKTPFELLFKAKPDYNLLKVFGCLCYPFMRPYTRNKLQNRSEAATFIGYSSSHKGYKALLPSGKIIVTRDFLFDESKFPFLSSSTHAPINHAPLPFFSFPLHQPDIAPQPQQCPQAIVSTSVSTHSTPPTSPQPNTIICNTYYQCASNGTRAKRGIFKPKLYNTSIPSYTLPKSVIAALLIPIWKDAMLAEFLALLRNKTWTLTMLPPGKNAIGCTWIFKLKMHADGSIARHKARLVAQGFKLDSTLLKLLVR